MHCTVNRLHCAVYCTVNNTAFSSALQYKVYCTFCVLHCPFPAQGCRNKQRQTAKTPLERERKYQIKFGGFSEQSSAMYMDLFCACWAVNSVHYWGYYNIHCESECLV